MFQKALGRVVEAFLGPRATVEAAAALCKSTQDLYHAGSLEIVGNLPTADRKFSAHNADVLLRPTPPVNPPIITKALLKVDNAPNALSDRRGDNGYAIHVKRGVFRNEGENWLLKWAICDTTGTVEDRRADEISTAVLTTGYSYADCFECSDSKGRGQTRVPVRVFHQPGWDLPAAGETVSYLRDQAGLAWPLGGAAAAETETYYAKASSSWCWHTTATTDYTGEVAFVSCLQCDDIFGNNTSGTTINLFLRATQVRDPNVQIDDILEWSYDANDLRTPLSVYDDDKVGFAKKWEGAGPDDIPPGWSLTTEMGARFPAGYKAGSNDYGTFGAKGGKHPIQPHRHHYTDADDTWFVDPDTGNWEDSNWLLEDHPSTDTSTEQTLVSVNATTVVTNVQKVDITIGSTSGNTGTQSLTVSTDSGDSDATSLTITGDVTIATASLAITGSVSIATADALISIDDATAHQHNLAGAWHCHADAGFDVVWLMTTTKTESAGSHAHTISQTAHTHVATDTYAVTTNPHNHTASHTLVVSPTSHTHSQSHSHTVSPDPHQHGLGSHTHSATDADGHSHTTDHTHTTTDPGHHHTTPVMEHIGTLTHREEDFRPPYRVCLFIHRVDANHGPASGALYA